MNRIYKSIFNEQTGTYVAVSENTKNKGKKGNKVLAATALSAALGFGAMGSAQAQLVSACTGVSLPSSVVSDVVVGDILYPILTGLPVVGPVVSLLGVDGLLAQVVDGDPVKLNVLDTSGTVLSDNAPCETTADSYTLNTEGGIAIGGNKITGLGANGMEAEATDITSIAFGNNAKALSVNTIAVGTGAQATAAGSTALGAGAQANATNSVALGNGSVATVANTVSVGSVGNERKITNVADGTVAAGSTDAINGGQLHQLAISTGLGLVQQADNLAPITVGKDSAGTVVDFTNIAAQTRKLTGIADGELSATSTDAVTGKQLNATNQSIATLSDNAVQYDGADKSMVTLGGATGTTITNVQAGAVNATSSDAINGAQLYAGNQSIATALGGGAAVNADGTISAPSYAVDATLPAFDNVGGALGNLAGRVAGNETSITNIEGDITSIINGETGIVKQDATTRNITVGSETDGTVVDFTGTDGVRTLTGLKDGELSATSTDAVTGNQLFNTNTELAATNANLDSTLAALGGGAQVDPVSGTVTAPSYVLDDGTNTGVTTSFDNVGGALGNLDGRVTSNTGRITNIEGDITDITNDLGDLTANAVTYTDATKTAINLAGAGGTTISNLKDGEVSASSTEAINGAQLYRSTSDLAAALGGNAVVDADGNLTNVGYDFIAGTQTSVGDALLNLDTRVDSNTTNITNLMNGTSGLVQQANGTAPITVGVATGGTIVDFTGTDGVRKLTGVANGSVAAGSTDAITGDQLFTSSKSVADALGGGSTVDPTTGAVSAPEYELDDGTDSGTKVTVTGVEDALTNLDGRVASNTTEITTIKGDISNIQTDITNITNGTLGIVKQNGTTRVITVGGDTDGAEVNFAGTAGVRKLTGIANGNVAAGSTEAVTGDQLNTTNVAVAAALTALGGGASIDTNGVVTGPIYDIGGASFDNVGGALTNLDGRVTSNTNRITTIEGDITNIKGDITNLDGRVTTIEGDITDIKNGAAGIVKFDSAADKITVGSEVAGSSVDFTGTAGVRKLTGIADGELSATSSDAVTGKQLHATNQQVKASSQFTASALGGGAKANDDGTFVNPLYALQEIQQDGSKKAVTFDNVGGALTSLNTSVASLQDQINTNTAIGLVRQDSTTRVISVGGNTDGTEVNFANSNGEARVISGVAAGKGPTDAVNVQQAQEMIAGATNSLKGDIRRAEKRADAGAAAATAVATLGQAYQPGQSAFSVGGGTWRGEAGYAVGLSTVSENGKWLLKGAVSGSGRGGAGGGASVTYLW
ncbi:YadA-like family protein [Advenella alkanexedens]|uniref:YadA-like family protein n=1 Tax=Advenella alkanexedens TaxID=1481665 RepID=A0ABS6NN55_9BURK|nr:ESPR-type extended signal peptide-containing protein [Advenella alkanexedens]MBV4397056.1 YadA-like family protein [Advenella alkanexedens]